MVHIFKAILFLLVRVGIANALKEAIMETYVVRIYRYQKDNPRGLVGTVESVKGKKRGKRAFGSLDDLWGILNSKMSDTVLPQQEGVWQRKDGGAQNPFKK